MILLTGGTGTVGRALLRRLVATRTPSAAWCATQGPGPRPRAGADRARRPGRAGVVPQRAARRGHRGAPGGVDPRPAHGLDRGAERRWPPCGWCGRPSASGAKRFVFMSAIGREPAVAHALLPLEGAGRAGGRVGRPVDHGVRALDRLHARGSLAHAAGAAGAAARRADRRARARRASSRSGRRTWPTAWSPRWSAPGAERRRSSTWPARSRCPTTSWCGRRCGPSGASARWCTCRCPWCAARCGRLRAGGRAGDLRHRGRGRADGGADDHARAGRRTPRRWASTRCG